MISTTTEQWSTFIAEICGAATPGSNGVINVEHVAYGGVDFVGVETGVRLNYTASEWQAFEAGVKAGEFGDTPARAFAG